MKKIYLMLASALIGTGSIMAGTTWNAQKLGVVKVDTLYHATVGPGTTQTQIHISYTRNGSPAESTITYTTSDLSNEYVTIKAGVASHAAYGKPQTVKGMMSDRTSYQNHYFVGINGDFAGLETTQSIPCGAMFEDGSFVTGAATLSGNILSNYLVVDKDGVPTIAETITYNHNKAGTVQYPSGAVETELTANNGRWDECVIAYNEFYGYGTDQLGSTHTNQWGNEAALVPVTTNVIYGNEAEFRVTKMATAGNMVVPHNGLVLSGVGSKRTDGKIDALKINDIVKIKFPFQADGKDMSARDVLGGWGITVKDGVVQNLPAKVPTDIAANTPRARTAVGYNEDKTKFIMAVVQEENSKGLNGMTIVEFGDVLASLGCHTALNLDGGGSSVMFVENLGQRSDVQGLGLGGFTRSVANGLFAVNVAPEDAEVARIEFVDKSLIIKPGRGYQPVIYAYNQYGSLISTGLQNYTLSAAEATFDASKRKMIAPESGKFALTAEYKGIKTTIPVYVDAAGIDGSDPATAPSFKGEEFVEQLKDPNAPIAPEDQIFAELQDVTPAGYDFDKYEVGNTFPLAVLPENTTGTFYTTPQAAYSKEAFDKNGQVTAVHRRPFNSVSSTPEAIADVQNGLSIQDLGGNIGKCLVYTRIWGPGASVKTWPNTSNSNAGPIMFTFFSDEVNRNVGDYTKPIRVRLVFQVLHRARHDSGDSQTQVPNVYACAYNSGSFWELAHDGVGEMTTGANYPIVASDFYYWENEGKTIAEIPEYPVLEDRLGEADVWDSGADATTNKYLMNPDRFMVYEFDTYSAHSGPIGVHFVLEGTHNTVIFKEVKFYNVLNGKDIATQPRAFAPSRVANAEKPFKSRTEYGSLLGTRSISYRYYTDEGVKEFQAETNTGIDDVVVDGEENAPVEYYNLQGIRVENPANGIYIKRQGSKATKVIIR